MTLPARLFVAALLVALLAAVCWQVLPRVGVDVPPAVPIVGFLIIALGTLVSLPPEEKPDESDESADDSDGSLKFDRHEPPDADR